MKPTWKPHEKHGELTERSDLPDSVFAFPKERKEPLTDAAHVRNAIARFDQVIDVSDDERELAFANIKQAADYYGVKMSESDWEDLGSRPHTGRTADYRKVAEGVNNCKGYPSVWRRRALRSNGARRDASLG
ncbi:MAG TPA: DUF6582 domain-containing protein [Solirubrobacteraceae bacterium]|nr:DUF6582 domain-containing protein [Solirubrobacteraceae bacterium]